MNPDQLKEYLDLKKLISWVLGSLILLTVLTIATGIISDSLAMDAIAVDCGASLVLHLFSLITVNIMEKPGHALFVDDPKGFNDAARSFSLAAFARKVQP